jgi:hypothetical protein
MRFDKALALAEQGFHLFPVTKNGKTPAVDDWPSKATRNPQQLKKWFDNGKGYNIGIATEKFGDDRALIVVDVDTKNGKKGEEELFKLDMEGFDFPVSLEQATPSGGRHIIYVSDTPCKQGVDVLGSGLDIRSRGGYIVGMGSEIDGRQYAQINGHGHIAAAPEWLVNRLGKAKDVVAQANIVLPNIDAAKAEQRAIEYLLKAPIAIEGTAGDLTTYKVAAKCKDMGCTEAQALSLMAEHWNVECMPPWSPEELEAKVRNAFRYGREPQGATAPEAVFTAADAEPVAAGTGLHPLDKMNQQYAYIKKGGFVLNETTDEDGNYVAEYMALTDLHAWYANVPFKKGDAKPRPLSMEWMEYSHRRQYEAIIFSPEQDKGERFYNLWRGFTVKPAEHGNHPSVEAFKEHALKNVCKGDHKLYTWLMGYFAHMVQRPWEKPLVAAVFKGGKGVGKNALVERVGALFGQHFMVASDERYLLGNFNSHFESNLMFVLDEASWAGNKRAEGKLKDLITGTRHNIERKGMEPYKAKNLSRVVIIGNEDWLVPASEDERRFAVFDVGNGRKQDRQFFHDMRVGMEQGGYAHLLKFLQDFDISAIDVNAAPATTGLTDQKLHSLEPLARWWHDCLANNELLGSGFDGDFPDRVPSNRWLPAFEQWCKSKQIRSQLPGKNKVLEKLRALAPSMDYKKDPHPKNPNDATYAWFNPGLDELRANFEAYLNGPVAW